MVFLRRCLWAYAEHPLLSRKIYFVIREREMKTGKNRRCIEDLNSLRIHNVACGIWSEKTTTTGLKKQQQWVGKSTTTRKKSLILTRQPMIVTESHSILNRNASWFDPFFPVSRSAAQRVICVIVVDISIHHIAGCHGYHSPPTAIAHRVTTWQHDKLISTPEPPAGTDNNPTEKN